VDDLYNLPGSGGCDDSLAKRLRGLARGLEDAALAKVTGEGEMAEAATLEKLLRAGRCDAALALCRAQMGDRRPDRVLRLYGQIVLPAIRRLEGAWKVDQIEFAELSMAFLNLHRLLADLTGLRGAEPSMPWPGGILVATVPGEDHVFGAQILADLLQASGHGVTLLLRTTPDILARQLAGHHHSAVCLSVGHDQVLEGLADLIAELRTISCNPALSVLIGGTALVEPQSQYHFLGADVVALSAEAAVSHLSRFRIVQRTASRN